MSTKAHEYAQKVIDGEIVACKQVIKACHRFFRDLEDERFIFRQDHYEFSVNFIELLEHTVGRLSGQNFKLEPWQHFIVANIFGFYWNSGDNKGFRRFTRSYITVPRKNGKSTFASACSLLVFFTDGEGSAQVYSAAPSLKQAKIIFEESARVCKQVDFLKDAYESKELKVYESYNNKLIQFGNSIYQPLTWSPKKLDGLNTHFAVVDEYHEHPTDFMYNVVLNSMGSRMQPHLMTITTAGFNKISPCKIHQEFCEQVLEDTIKDEALFTVIYTIDDGDSWMDVNTWNKANPNMGVSIQRRQMEQALAEAMQNPRKEVEFKTKLLNIWCDAAESWISSELFRNAQVPVESAEELCVGKCFASLDLASVRDSTALTLFWPETMTFRTWYFLPKQAIESRTDDTGEQIRAWAREGYIISTEGNATDYDYIYEKLKELAEKYEIYDLTYDRWNSSQLVIKLGEEGFNCYLMGQGYKSMDSPVKTLEAGLLKQELKWIYNPCDLWQIGNVVISTDPSGNVKMNKDKSKQKIDGPVSWAMAMGGYLYYLQGQIAGELYAV